MQDYNYIYKGSFELTLEISCCKYPPERDLPKLWDQNKDALVAYLQNAHMGEWPPPLHLYSSVLPHSLPLLSIPPLSLFSPPPLDS